MNISCIICSDLFTPTSEIYGTNCGHLFHYVCLIQWLDRSKSCPQCRHKTTEKTITRIYLNLQSTDGIEDDVGTLQAKVDNLNFQIRLKDKDIKNSTEKYQTIKTQNVGLRDEIRTLEGAARVHDSAIHALKDQIAYFKQKVKEGEGLREDVRRMQDRVRNMESLDVVMNGNKDQVSDMLRHNRDPESLAILVTSLKKELVEAERRKRHVSTKLLQSQNESNALKREKHELQKDITKLRRDIEDHANCEKERRYLKSKISEMQTKLSANDSCYSPNTSLKRIVNESPAPLRPDFNDGFVDLTESPTMAEKVKATQESDSPYLQLKTGFNTLMNKKFSLISGNRAASSTAENALNKFSIFKGNSARGIDELRLTRPEYEYNGLGGHSKEDHYPSPTKSSQSSTSTTFNLKRTKSSSSMPTSKFRKLSNNKRLDDMLKPSQ